jgi:hypothetical protein
VADNVICLEVVHQTRDAEHLGNMVDAANDQLRRTLFRKLEEVQEVNLLDASLQTCINAIQASTAIKSLIAETYPDVQNRFAELSLELGRPVTNEDAVQVARRLHPECFEVRLR